MPWTVPRLLFVLLNPASRPPETLPILSCVELKPVWICSDRLWVLLLIPLICNCVWLIAVLTSPIVSLILSNASPSFTKSSSILPTAPNRLLKNPARPRQTSAQNSVIQAKCVKMFSQYLLKPACKVSQTTRRLTLAQQHLQQSTAATNTCATAREFLCTAGSMPQKLLKKRCLL